MPFEGKITENSNKIPEKFHATLDAPQAYHPLSLWYRFIKLASAKAKTRALRSDENVIKTLKIVAILVNFVFLSLFWRFVALDGWKENKAAGTRFATWKVMNPRHPVEPF